MAAAKFTSRAAGTVPFLLGGAAFILFFLGLQSSAVVSLVAAAAVIVGGSLLFAPPRRSAVLQAAGLSPEMFETTLREGRANLDHIRAAAARIADKTIRDKVLGIGDSVEKILAEARKNPQDVRVARQFLSYYLEATLKIVEKYIDMSVHGPALPELRPSLNKVEGMLDIIDGAFRRQLTKLLQNDMMDLDAEIALLDKTIRMEGWGGDTPHEK